MMMYSEAERLQNKKMGQSDIFYENNFGLMRSPDDGIKRGMYDYEKKRRPQSESNGEEHIDGKTTIVTTKKHINLFALSFCVVVVLLLAIVAGVTLSSVGNYTTFYRFYGNALASEKKPYASMVVIEPKSQRVLNAYEENKRLPMASTTKIMTAILVLENVDDLNMVVPMPRESAGIEGTSIYLRAGESLSIKDLLYGLILASGNDCATALAILCAGNEEAFVSMMNEKACELGLQNTHFCNPHGLHNDNHYTTTLDLAKITAYALQNEEFVKLVSTKRHTIEKTKETDTRYLKNKQKLLFDEELNAGELQITGVKSGFTPEAGRCLVTSAYKGDMEAVCVVFNCPEMFDISEDLILKAFDEYNYATITEPYVYLSNLPVLNGEHETINVYAEYGFSYPVQKNGADIVKVEVLPNETIEAPIEEGQIVGEIKVYVNNEEMFVSPIHSMESVKSTKVQDITKEIIQNFI